MPQRSRSTSIRSLGRLLEASPLPAWAIDPDGVLVYLSSVCGDWLNVPPEMLLGRSTLTLPSPAVDDSDAERLLAALAQSLAAPPGLLQRRHMVHRLQPSAVRVDDEDSVQPATTPLAPTTAIFVALDETEAPSVLGFAGPFSEAPVTPDMQVALQIRETLDRWRAAQPALSELPVALGSSREAKRLRAQMRVAASTHEHVVLIGPPGCGSRAIASGIAVEVARQSGQPKPPLVTVEGALMDAELLDATIAPVVDWLTERESRRGSLLVTEIDQMPADAQSRLNQWIDQLAPRLRLFALSRVEIRGPQVTPSQPPSPLQPALAAKLDVLSIDVPPLRQRSDDIPAIATALLMRRRAAGEGRAEQFGRAAIDALTLYPWPKHFEELEAAIRQAIRTCRGSSIQPDHLPLAIRSYRPADPSTRAEQVPIDLDQTLRNVERQLIQRALEQTDGNRAEAARRLNISRARLLRRLDEDEP